MSSARRPRPVVGRSGRACGSVRRSLSSMMSALSTRAGTCSRPWWAQKSSSPPACRRARTYAWAPQRSQRSAAVRAGASAAFTSASSARSGSCWWFSGDRPVRIGDLCDSQARRMLPAAQGSELSRAVSEIVTFGRAGPVPRPRRCASPEAVGARRIPLPDVPATAAKKTATSKSASEYTAHHLQVLEGLEAVRKRPGMYIGSTDSRGLMHCLWEIIDNAVDEALGGHCDRIEVILHADGSVEVRDNGRGVPVDIEPRTGLTGVELVYTRLHAGGKFGGGSYTASGGLHGVGASVVNALSSRLDVEVDRGRQDVRDELPARRARRRSPTSRAPPAARTPTTSSRRTSGPAPSRSSARPGGGSPAPGCATGPTGRSSSRTPASTSTGLLGRARQTSFLVPGLTIVVRDERGRGARPRRSSSTTAASPSSASTSPPTPPSPTCGGSRARGTFTETVPVLDAQGHMTPDRGRARVRRRRRRALGHRLRHDGAAPSSTSSPRPRAAPTSPASTRPCSRCCASRSRPTPAGSRRATTRSRRTTRSPGSRRSSPSGSPSRSSRARPRRCSAPRRCAPSSPRSSRPS